ncbi:hypothetical protein H5V43_22025 (plasmid) [Sphingobium fuliginis]|uniref:DeoxyPurine in DNA protein A domain-containing protein n=1 Tax=Sphingobium fuliginis (strain ATCC 27551) TaxID=336203 RepID=A0A7M2GRN1_SPHSA|nr:MULTISPECIES: hypothetical protein [Sphingobium]QOT74549.1 hypothetical protein H5V43_22025 [Sphingobium fuliginis]
MTIEIIVGLPHLNKGPILDRVVDLKQPALISANCQSRWSSARGYREWTGWRTRQLANARRLPALHLDSAGFVATSRYGAFPWSIARYVGLAAAYPFRWWASADYCVEAEIAPDRAQVIERLSRTIAANRECRRYADDHGNSSTMMPVIQGRRPCDYERCVDGLWGMIERAPLLGVGSMCRREVHRPEGLIAVVEHLDRILPPAIQLHLFGVKGPAIPYLLPFGKRIRSLDSQAYGTSARHEALKRNISKSDRFVADHLEAWLTAQARRLRQKPQMLPMTGPQASDRPPADPWEAAIAAARREIQALIELGDLDHDAIIEPWIEQWAADIYLAEAPNQ